MRIGMMTDVYKPHVSGITNYISLNKEYLEKAGHEVFIFTFGDLDYADDEERVVRSPGLPLTDTGYYLSFRYSRRAKALLQTMDLVHVHHPFLSGRLALNYCRPLRIPIVFTNHTRYDLYAQAYLPLLPEELSDTFLQSYMPTFCQAVDLVISPIRRDGRSLAETGRQQPDRDHPQRCGPATLPAPPAKTAVRNSGSGKRISCSFIPGGWGRKRTWIFSSTLLPGLPKPSRTPICWSSAADRKSRP